MLRAEEGGYLPRCVLAEPVDGVIPASTYAGSVCEDSYAATLEEVEASFHEEVDSQIHVRHDSEFARARPAKIKRNCWLPEASLS